MRIDNGRNANNDRNIQNNVNGLNNQNSQNNQNDRSIHVFVNRNVIGGNRRTVWSLLCGTDSYWVDLPENFRLGKDDKGDPVLVDANGQSYPAHQILQGDERPYLQVGYKVFPLSNFRRER